jgi:putative tricarboxylic transport membrane protein
MSQGDPMVLFQHWSSALMIGLAVLALVLPFVFKGLARMGKDED